MKTLGYVGALQALVERGVQFASVSACSAGTLFGACLCAGVSPQRLANFVLDAELGGLLDKQVTPWLPASVSMLRWPHAQFQDGATRS